MNEIRTATSTEKTQQVTNANHAGVFAERRKDREKQLTIFDQLFKPVHTVVIPAAVSLEDVPRLEEAVGREGFPCSLRVVEIFLEDIRPFDPEFSGLVCVSLVSILTSLSPIER